MGPTHSLAVPAMHEGLLRDVPDWRIMLPQSGVAALLTGQDCIATALLSAHALMQYMALRHMAAAAEIDVS